VGYNLRFAPMPTTQWMQDHACPKCSHTGRYLPAPSDIASWNYYRCGECGHVWCVNKQTHARHDVTIPATQKRA